MISRIKIENFKSIKELDICLRPINILIGANGVGKSNFIEIFKLLNQIYEQRLQEYIGNDIDSLLYFGRKKSSFLSMLLFFETEDKKIETTLRIIIHPKQNSNNGYLKTVSCANVEPFKNHNFSYIDENVDESRLKDKEPSSLNFERKHLESFKIYHFHDTSSTSPLKAPSQINDNRYLAENGRNLAAYLYYLQEKHPKSFKQIEFIVRSVAPFFDRFDLQPDRLNEKQIELRWQEKESDFPFSAYHLSDGTLRFIALATLFLQPELPKIIIIDEPELGLHPFAIHKLAGLINKASVSSQIIISTQSVTLVDNFSADDIITVDRKEKQSVFTLQSSESLEDWLKEYTIGDVWNKNVIGARP
ncbi:AAA family ATPase [Bernardetia sp. OM2101]|uniref:AAA family ATPase n=1 Tax=Bernardetia sp. OM2101 TaxID=3344876 RepID=UPI0035CF2E4F